MPGQKGHGCLQQVLIENTYLLPSTVLDVGTTVILKIDKVSMVLELTFCRGETVMSNLKKKSGGMQRAYVMKRDSERRAMIDRGWVDESDRPH